MILRYCCHSQANCLIVRCAQWLLNDGKGFYRIKPVTDTFRRGSQGENESMTDSEYQQYLRSDAWKQKAAERLKIDELTCQFCGSRGTQLNELQVHHMSYRSVGGNEDVYKDLVTLCRSCHKGIHAMMNRKTSAEGRHGWKDQPGVPKIHVFTMSGEGIASITERG